MNSTKFMLAFSVLALLVVSLLILTQQTTQSYAASLSGNGEAAMLAQSGGSESRLERLQRFYRGMSASPVTDNTGAASSSSSASGAPSASAAATTPTAAPLVPLSKYAYVTLIHGIDETFRYRGFLYNTLIAAKLLRGLGSTADFVAMVGFSDGARNPSFEPDLDLLRSTGIKVLYLPRLLTGPDAAAKVNFAEMALLKITPWSMTMYDRVMYVDADVMPRKNLDAYFAASTNMYHSGLASPVNSGWFIALPNAEQYEDMRAMAVSRLTKPWDVTTGWGREVPAGLEFRTHKPVKKWDFNGASLDQGLFTDYFVMRNGGVTIVHQDNCIRYDAGFRPTAVPLDDCLSFSGGRAAMELFAHFTGRNKPWMKAPGKDRAGRDVAMWYRTLDSLRLPINSTSLSPDKLKPPLGFFHPNK